MKCHCAVTKFVVKVLHPFLNGRKNRTLVGYPFSSRIVRCQLMCSKCWTRAVHFLLDIVIACGTVSQNCPVPLFLGPALTQLFTSTIGCLVGSVMLRAGKTLQSAVQWASSNRETLGYYIQTVHCDQTLEKHLYQSP